MRLDLHVHFSPLQVFISPSPSGGSSPSPDTVLILAAIEGSTQTMATDLDTAVASLSADDAALIAQIPIAVSKAVSDALTANNVDAATQTATLNTVDAQVKAALAAITPAPPKPTALVVADVSIAVGATSPVPIAVTGGVGPYTASGLPAGVTYDGTANLVPSGAQVAGTSTITFTDSATPPATGTGTVTIA